MICALVVIISAAVLITGCPSAQTPAPAPAPTPEPKPEPEIEGIPWQCTYSIYEDWAKTVLTLNGTEATFKDPDKDASYVSCLIDKANKKIKLIFSSGTDEYDYVIKENGTVLELSMKGTLKHKFKKI